MRVAHRLQVEQRLPQIGARVKVSKRADDGGNADPGKMKGEAELGQIHLGNIGIRLQVQVRKQGAQLLPALAARAVHIGT